MAATFEWTESIPSLNQDTTLLSHPAPSRLLYGIFFLFFFCFFFWGGGGGGGAYTQKAGSKQQNLKNCKNRTSASNVGALREGVGEYILLVKDST